MIKRGNGLTYTIGDLDAGIASNIDMMGHDDPSIRATARLNRDLANALASFLETEAPQVAPPLSTMTATMHGVATVCGTLLMTIESQIDRQQARALMRARLLQIFDAMGDAIEREHAP